VKETIQEMLVELHYLPLILAALLSGSTRAETFPGVASVRAWGETISKSIPALNTNRFHMSCASSSNRQQKCVEASVKSKTKTHNTGFYYGLNESILRSRSSNEPKKESLNSMMSDALSELKSMKQEMEALRKEMRAMKARLSDGDNTDEQPEDPVSALFARRKRQREFDQIGVEVEKWAENILFKEGEEEDGWKEVPCNQLVRNRYNPEGNIKCFLKWMKDSRGSYADPDDDKEYPCIKVYATIDAPIDEVCTYLAEAKRLPEYNDLVVQHRDLEEISPHSKICWGKCPQILFINPRDFVTFCHHRWLRDGTQVVVNQAVEHTDVPAVKEDVKGKVCRAQALRGANFIMKHPDDPNKTKFALVAHANPGGDIPQWACKTAVNAIAPIEPYKLFHKINDNVRRAIPQLQVERAEMVGSASGRSCKPGGLSQMGYACFWPNGGGLREGLIHPAHADFIDPTETEHENSREQNIETLDKEGA